MDTGDSGSSSGSSEDPTVDDRPTDDDSTTGADGPTSDASTTADSSASEIATTESGTTTPPAGCGDGVLDGDEQCDDGNAIDGDGCDADCTTSAASLWQTTWDGVGQDDHLFRVVVDSTNRIHVLGATGMGDQYDYVLVALEEDGELDTNEELGPYQAFGLNLRDDDALVLAGRQADLDAPWVRTYDADGTMEWELVDEMQAGTGLHSPHWLDDGSVALAGQNAGYEQLVAHISGEGELLSSEVVFDGSIYGVALAGDVLVATGSTYPENSFWLAGMDPTGTVLWTHTDDSGLGYGIAITPEQEILALSGGVARFSADGDPLGVHPFDQPWWDAPSIAIDLSGDVLLVGNVFPMVDAFARCHVARLGPDLAEKWARTIEESIGCTAIHPAPDGTLVVVGHSLSEGADSTVGFIARLAP